MLSIVSSGFFFSGQFKAVGELSYWRLTLEIVFASAPTPNGPARSPLFPGGPVAPLLGGKRPRVPAPARFGLMATSKFPKGRVLNPGAPRCEAEITSVANEIPPGESYERPHDQSRGPILGPLPLSSIRAAPRFFCALRVNCISAVLPTRERLGGAKTGGSRQ